MSESHGRRPAPVSTDEDVDRELRAHLALHAERLIAEGVSPAEARRKAREAFGNLSAISTQCRHISASNSPWTLSTMIDSIVSDVRFALRTLRRSPVFAISAIATLAIGIGANSAIYSVVHTALIRPLPYPEADRLVSLWERNEGGSESAIAAPNFFDWQAESSSFASMAMMSTFFFGGRTSVLGGEQPVRLYVAGVTEDFFRTMGVMPSRGRAFDTAETQEGAAPTIVVSERIWRNLLGAPEDLTGHTLRVYGVEATVIGVMPSGFNFPGDSDVWWPIGLSGFNTSRTSHNWAAIARLAPDVSVATAQQELDTIGAALKVAHGEEIDAVGVVVRSLRDELVGGARTPMILLLAAAGLVLLLACTNLASTLLARGTARADEIAVRGALGAARGRLIRQLFTESLLIGGTGAVCGLILGHLGLTALLQFAPGGVPVETASVGGGVVGFVAPLTLLATLLFGLVPAFGITRGGTDALRSGRGAIGVGGQLWNVLVVAEVALAILLLTGAGLMIRSFWQVMQVHTGYEAENVLTAEVAIPSALYAEDGDAARILEAMASDIAALPGVEATGFVNHLPMAGLSINGAFNVEGSGLSNAYASYRVTGGNYFEAMRIPLLEGRLFDARDIQGAEPVVIVNASFAAAVFPGESAVGKRIGNLANDNWIYGDEWMRIIGVVGDVRHGGPERPAHRETYVHYLQRPYRARGPSFAIRIAGDPAAVTPLIRERVARLDDQIPIEFKALEEHVQAAAAPRTFTLLVLGVFAAVALSLAAVGIYGVVSYAVARRHREMGIRMALGAAPRSVQRMVIGESLRRVGIGVALGVGAAVAATRLLDSMLFEVDRLDPVAFVAGAVALLGAATLASWLPARRSARVDPAVAIRND